MIAEIHDQQLRGKWLGGVPGGALFLASSTLRAGGEVHDALPGEILHLSGADGVRFWIGVFHGQGSALGSHGLGGTQGVAAIGISLEEDIEEGQEAVPCHAPADVQAHDEQPNHAGEQLDHGEDGHQQRGFREDLRDLHGEEIRCCVPALVGGEGGDLGGFHEDHAQALDQHHGFYEVCGFGIGAVEAGPLLLIADPLTNDDQRDNAQDSRDTQQLIHEVIDAPTAEDGPATLRVEDLNVGLKPDDGPQQESHHDHPVCNGHTWLFRHLGVAQDLLDQVEQAPSRIIHTAQRGLADPDGGEDPPSATDEKHPGGK